MYEKVCYLNFLKRNVEQKCARNLSHLFTYRHMVILVTQKSPELLPFYFCKMQLQKLCLATLFSKVSFCTRILARHKFLIVQIGVVVSCASIKSSVRRKPNVENGQNEWMLRWRWSFTVGWLNMRFCFPLFRRLFNVRVFYFDNYPE